MVPSSPSKALPCVQDNSEAQSNAPSSIAGNQVTIVSNSCESLPLLSSPVLDPKIVSAAASVHSLTMKNDDEFEFDSPLKAFSKNEIRKDKISL